MTNPTTNDETPCGLLAQTNFFGRLTPSQLERVAALSTVQDCEAGQQVYRVGDPADQVYVLVHARSGTRSALVGAMPASATSCAAASCSAGPR